jgi:hypothetical protein
MQKGSGQWAVGSGQWAVGSGASGQESGIRGASARFALRDSRGGCPHIRCGGETRQKALFEFLRGCAGGRAWFRCGNCCEGGASSGAKARRSIVAFDAGLNGLLHPLVLSFLFSVFGFQLSVFSFLFSILAFSTVPPRFARRDSRGGCHHIVLPMANRSQKQRRARAPAPHLHGELLAVRHCWFLDRLA